MKAIHKRRGWRAAVCSAVAAFTLAAVPGTVAQASAPPKPTSDVAADAVNAYIYGYSLIMMRATEQASTNVVEPDPATNRAPVNQLANADTLNTPDQRVIAAGNVDTLYSLAWLDLKNEPMVLHLPDTHGRLVMMPMLDAWMNVFASPGTRTTGSAAGDFAVTGPGWKGRLPAGVTQIKSPTETVWIVGRTQLDGPSDLPAVKDLVGQYTLKPLSAHGRDYTPPAGQIDPTVPATNPVDRVAGMDAETYFSQLASLMATNPPAKDDAPMVATLARLGIIPGKPFNINARGPATAEALRQAVTEGNKQIQAGIAKVTEQVNGWSVNLHLGTYGTNYLLRSVAAMVGIGPNIPEDSVYMHAFHDGQGNPLNGANKYVIHFPPGQTPPVDAFWSLTMYDPSGFLVDNPIDRYEVGHNAKPTPNADGSVDIYLQHDAPAGMESNWLPAPSGQFWMMLRMYSPQASVMDGTWTPPAVTIAS